VANEKSLSLPEIESYSLVTSSNIIAFKPYQITHGSAEIMGGGGSKDGWLNLDLRPPWFL
jgi:hypothetical protein